MSHDSRPPGRRLVPWRRWPVAVAAALTFGAGALDVLALTHLGSVFASVMTGNLALLGLGIARANSDIVIHAAVGVFSYGIGVAVGSRIIGSRTPASPPWPRSVTATLGVQFVVLIALFAGWAVNGTVPTGYLQLVFLSAAAAAMGLQSAAMRGLGEPVATTYLTGTLTSLVASRTSSPKVKADPAAVAALIAALCGAASCGVVLLMAPTMTPLLTVGPLAVVLMAALYRHRRTAPPPAD